MSKHTNTAKDVDRDSITTEVTHVQDWNGGSLHRIGGVDMVVLNGTYKEMGRQYGHLAKDKMIAALAGWKKIFIDSGALDFELTRSLDGVLKHGLLVRQMLLGAVISICLTGPVAAQEGSASADEIARQLANPNTPLASLTFKNQFRWYDGDLPGANEQHNYTFLFQPVLPFDVGQSTTGGDATVFFRPAFPLLFDQPVFNIDSLGFDGEMGLGDIGFDLAYGVTEQSGFLWAVGAVGTLPTATNHDLGGEQWRLGPELLVAQFEDWGVYGIFPSHQWNIAGEDYEFSNSQIQLFLNFLPGDAWTVGTTPILNYDWTSEQWTIPLNLTVSKTVQWGSTPVKLATEFNYYVERPDAFGPEWMISFNITPVVRNVFADLLR